MRPVPPARHAVAAPAGTPAGGRLGRTSAGRRVASALRRDRTELLAAAVVALAILAGLTSWGALDLGSAASEAAPIISGPASGLATGDAPTARGEQAGSVLGGEHPAVDLALVVEQLLRAEPEGDSAAAFSGAVRRVDQVLRRLERRSRRGSSPARPRAGGSRRSSRGRRDRVRALEDGRDERAAGDEVDEAGEERLLAMDGVVPLGEVAVDVDELQPDELQARAPRSGRGSGRRAGAGRRRA